MQYVRVPYIRYKSLVFYHKKLRMVNYIRCFMMSVNKNRIFRNDVSCTVSFEQKAQKPNITIYVLCKRHTVPLSKCVFMRVQCTSTQILWHQQISVIRFVISVSHSSDWIIRYIERPLSDRTTKLIISTCWKIILSR